jgi:hypothetical protein
MPRMYQIVSEVSMTLALVVVWLCLWG